MASLLGLMLALCAFVYVVATWPAVVATLLALLGFSLVIAGLFQLFRDGL